MSPLETFLKELKAMNSRPAYFESMRQIKDALVDNFPLDRSQWMCSSDTSDWITRLERSYNRTSFVKGDSVEGEP